MEFSLKQVEWLPTFGWEVQKDRHQGFYPLGTPVSFCLLVWRIPETGDRFEKGNGSRVTAAYLSPPFRSSQTAYCYTGGLFYAGAA